MKSDSGDNHTLREIAEIFDFFQPEGASDYELLVVEKLVAGGYLRLEQTEPVPDAESNPTYFVVYEKFDPES